MKNICYIVSGIDKALAFEWIAHYLDHSRFKLHFLLLHSREGELESYLKKKRVPCLRISYAGKTDLPSAVIHIYRYLKKEKIELVHCHLLDAGLAGLAAAWLLQVPQRIYTRHSSTYHHVYFPKGVLYDRLINFLSTRIVAVSGLVKKVLMQKEGVKESKISVIEHGFPLSNFIHAKAEAIQQMKDQYGFSAKWPVIGVISRYTEWKGIQYIVPAFKELLLNYPNAHLVLANAKGSYKNTIQGLLSEMEAVNYTEISFEKELFTLFHCFDLFVHAPVNDHSEAFGQVYIEAMAAGLPCVFTISGIAQDTVVHRHNALIARYQDSDSILKCLNELLGDPALREALGSAARQSVTPTFELSNMITKLEQLYG